MDLSTHNILSIIFLAIFLFIAFRMLQILLIRLINNKKLKKRFIKLLYFIELNTWIVLLYHFAEDFKHEKPILSLISGILLVLIVIWSFLFVLKDYFAGLYFKIFEDYQLNNRISFNDIQGIISALEIRHLILQTSNGELKIPYSNLFKNQITRLPEKKEEELTIYLNVKKADINENYIENLRKKILLMPWINLKYAPEINILDKENENIQIKLVLLDAKYKKNVEEYLL
ncbi:MAG: mechanosensitive ion channel [Bacteroidales bacterium]|nr:mechanosensitive ion channel [Bacteroidales bacterium]